MKKHWRKILIALLAAGGMSGCSQGADNTKLGAQLVSGSQPAFYVVQSITFTSEADSSRSMDGNSEALAVFLTAHPDGTVSLEAQTPECPSSGSPSACTGENAPQNFQGTWKKISNNQFEVTLQIPKERGSGSAQPLVLELEVPTSGGKTLVGKQTGGTSRIHIRGFDPNDRPSGVVSLIALQKMTKEATAADLAGKYNIVAAESKSFSNADSTLNKPLLDPGVTTAEVNLNNDGTFSLNILGGSGSPPSPGTWRIVDRNHVKIVSDGRTQTFTFRFLEGDKRLTLWNFNDTNSFGTGTDVSSTVMVNLVKP